MHKSFAIATLCVIFLAKTGTGRHLPEKRELPSRADECIEEAKEVASSKVKKVNDCLREAIPIGQEGKGLPEGSEMDECLLEKFVNIWEILEPPFTGPICTEVLSKLNENEEDELIKAFEPYQLALNAEQGQYFEELIGKKPAFLDDSDY